MALAMTESAPPVLADRELVARAHDPAGRDEALQALYERYKDEVYSFLVHLLRDPGLAEDAWHEAFVRVCLNIEHCDPERSFRAWLYQITRNAAFELLRNRARDERLAQVKAGSAPSPEAEPVVDEAARREAVLIAREALLDLPDDARALLVQRHGLGMKLEELAESWSVSERTVRSRLAAAASLLARKLGGLIDRRGPRGGGP